MKQRNKKEKIDRQKRTGQSRMGAAGSLKGDN
jgi:hypothetical protein